MRYRNIARVVAAAREQSGLSQAEICKELGWVSGQFMSNVERGISSIPPEKFRTFAQLTGISVLSLQEAHMADIRHDIERRSRALIIRTKARYGKV